MIIKSSGIRINKYYIPPFELNDGEIILIHLYGGSHYHDVKNELINILIGKTINNNITIIRPLTYVEYFVEPTLRRIFYPVTVGEYITKKGNKGNSITEKIYDIDYIHKKTKVNSLTGTPRKLLSMYTVLSYTREIVFDLDGLDPIGVGRVYEVVKSQIIPGGSAILIDWSDDMKNDCSKFISLEIKENN